MTIQELGVDAEAIAAATEATHRAAVLYCGWDAADDLCEMTKWELAKGDYTFGKYHRLNHRGMFCLRIGYD